MVTIVKKDTSIKSILEKLNLIFSKKNKGFDAKKYSGKLTNKIEDPLAFQKEMRDEW
ncbi:MAG: hypothetical protein ACI9M3_001030 [Bacteroidia bacterium]|jgi:hypothetical protein